MRLQPFLLLTGLWVGASPSEAIAQQDPARVQRDQGEVLRKAERLRGLMQSLLARYEREGDAEKVRLLKLGLEHLADSGVLDDVASVRNSLDAGALAEAVRKQSEVVGDLEQLLSILLQRPTAESLEEEMKKAGELAKDASELARRQAELQQAVERVTEGVANAAERELRETLGELSREARREAEENLRQAGVRRPTLEAALDRVRELLNDQTRLERQLEAEQGGRSASREQAFQMGELRAGQEQVQADQTRRAEFEALARDAEALRQATDARDDARTADQRDRLLAALNEAARGANPDTREGLAERARLEALATEVTE
ncbi:MAG: hypothetical protein ACO3UM_13085, partial [Planctomycetota bacterium]